MIEDERLVAFVRARLDEDEAAAMAATGTAWAWEATGDKDSSWAVGHVEGEDGRPLSGEIGHGQGVVIDGVCESINGNLADAAHIARHNPARVLREVEAKRRHLENYRRAAWATQTAPADEHNSLAGYRDAAWGAVLADAAVWSTHPDYWPEWKP